MTPLAARLASPEPPWVELWVLPDGQPPELPGPPSGVVLRRLDGGTCRTKRALLAELARALEFPAYVGRNWDALEEALGDLEWLPAAGYALVIDGAEQLLARREADYATFVSLLDAVGRERARPGGSTPARPPVPFHCVLTVQAGHRRSRRDWRVPVIRVSA
jgi:hypothetical protein